MSYTGTFVIYCSLKILLVIQTYIIDNKKKCDRFFVTIFPKFSQSARDQTILFGFAANRQRVRMYRFDFSWDTNGFSKLLGRNIENAMIMCQFWLLKQVVNVQYKNSTTFICVFSFMTSFWKYRENFHFHLSKFWGAEKNIYERKLTWSDYNDEMKQSQLTFAIKTWNYGEISISKNLIIFSY